jgi:cation transport ATPase
MYREQIQQDKQQMTPYKARLDKISIAVALACMLHCVLVPVLLTTLPLWGVEILENVYIELATIAIALVAGGWAVWTGYRKYHRKLFIPLLFTAGITLMAATTFFEHESIETIGKSMAALLVIIAQVLNWRASHRCNIACYSEGKPAAYEQ